VRAKPGFAVTSREGSAQDEPGVVLLLVPDTGKEVSRLTAPETIRLIPLCFTCDKRRAVFRSGVTASLHFFDWA
jgi:hypothetical protein